MKALLVLASLALTLLSAHGRKPDVLVILADDLGWSDLGCYGSEIQTPALDSLATHGLRFREFYNSSRCCPSRAALLTGLHPHQAGMGGMVDSGKAASGPYQGWLNDRCLTLAETLRPAGYRTLHTGKWHVGEKRPHWPVDRGFDHFHGLISGAMNYYDIRKGKTPGIRRTFAIDDRAVTPEPGKFYATDDFTDAALRLIDATAADQPLFLYLAYTAPHWPLHAPEELIAKYEALYREGWEPRRRERLDRLVASGMLPRDTPLPSRDAADWEKLTAAEKLAMTRKLATHAAMVDRMDWNIARVLAKLRELKRFDDTLIIFLSDNGASSESGPLGNNFRPDLQGPIGTVDSYHSFGRSGATLSNTPLRRFKAETYEGGIRTPCIVHWPAGLKARPGSISSEVGHVIDLMPTLLDVCGAEYPREIKGKALIPLQGLSLLPVFHGEKLPRRSLAWEHFGHAAWREGHLKAVRPGFGKAWELYDLTQDPLELEDLAASRPEELEKLTRSWQTWADEVGVRDKP
jgi:arylsulfatase